MNINRSDGWIKLHKSIIYSDLWQDKPAAYVFVSFLMFAHHTDNVGSVRMNGKQMYLKRGQFSATITELCDYFGIKRSTLKGILHRLKTSQRISQQSDNHNTVFSICNWDKYQGKENQPTSQPTSQPIANQLANQQRTQKNKELRIKNNSNVEIQSIYDHYIEVFKKNRNQYRLTNSRKTKIQARLADAGKDMLILAIDNTADSDFHMGDNDRGWRADLDFIIRSYEQTEKLANMAEQKSEDKADLNKLEIDWSKVR